MEYLEFTGHVLIKEVESEKFSGSFFSVVYNKVAENANIFILITVYILDLNNLQ